jgi:hypothetical protein
MHTEKLNLPLSKIFLMLVSAGVAAGVVAMLGLSTLHLPPAIPAFFVNIAADLVPVFKAIRQQNFLAAFFGPLRFFRKTFGRRSTNPPATVIYSAVPHLALLVRNYCHQLL